MAALLDLEQDYQLAQADPSFVAEYHELLRDRVGRPTLLHQVRRFAELLRVPGRASI